MTHQPDPRVSQPVRGRWRVAIAVCVVSAASVLAGARAHAVTLEDVVELSQAGIGEVVLVELIRMGDIVYPLTPSRLRALKAQGLSDPVLLALLRSGRTARDDGLQRNDRDRPGTTRTDGCGPGTRTACAPEVARVVPVPVLVPARAPASTPSGPRAEGPQTALGFGGVSGLGFVSTTTAGTGPTTGRKPVYWGWGGKKRPGSWNGHSNTNR